MLTDEKKGLILIVDRDLESLAWLDSLLTREGFRVTLCCSPDDALKAISTRRVDLVIVGSGKPEHSGEALIMKIKDLTPDTGILLFMEPGDEPDFAEIIAAGADGLLRKSYSVAQVHRQVDRLLMAARA
jgi:DNA-binding response OmpR family regulator